MQIMFIAIFYNKLLHFLETFKHLMNTWDSQTKHRNAKVLELLEQNVRTKITLQSSNIWGRTGAIFNLFANNLLDLEESNNKELSLPITKQQVKLGHGKTSKKPIYSLKTRSTCSPSSHFRVLSIESKLSASNKSDITVGSCGGHQL